MNRTRSFTLAGALSSVLAAHALAQSATYRLVYGINIPEQATYVMDYPGGTSYEVDVPISNPGRASISRDGEWLAMSGGIPVNSQIHICRSDPSASEFRTITSGTDDNVSPSFAPDGVQIVYHNVYGTLRFVSREGCAGPGINCGFIDTGTPGGHPDWSPGGTKIAYTNWATPSYYSDLFVRDLVTGSDRLVADGSEQALVAYVYATWSADSRKLAVERRDGPSNSPDADIWVLNIDGSGMLNITPELSNSHEGHPIWSPDGEYIFYSSNVTGHFAIWRMRPDGSQKTLVHSLTDTDVNLYDVGMGPECYANCDGSTAAPTLNVGDFACFLQRYAAGCH